MIQRIPILCGDDGHNYFIHDNQTESDQKIACLMRVIETCNAIIPIVGAIKAIISIVCGG